MNPFAKALGIETDDGVEDAPTLIRNEIKPFVSDPIPDIDHVLPPIEFTPVEIPVPQEPINVPHGTLSPVINPASLPVIKPTIEDTEYRVQKDMVAGTDDLIKARDSIKEDISLTSQAIQSTLDYANQTQDARSFDLLEKFLRLKMDQAKGLVQLTKTKQEAEDKAVTVRGKQKKIDVISDAGISKPVNTQQQKSKDSTVNVFVGSFADMQRAKKTQDESRIIDHVIPEGTDVTI